MTAASKPTLIPVSPVISQCGCGTGTGKNNFKWSNKLPPYIIEEYHSPSGPLPRITGAITWRDRLGTFRSRTSNFRMKYKVKPGLYALGKPDENSHVIVTANYKMSFDAVRKNLARHDAWILVLDTAGINVWCAAGKGSFGSAELIKKIDETGISSIVTHRGIVVPQLGAPGINSSLVKNATGFRVHFGPVLARDLPAYLSNNMTAEACMRIVPFTMWDRLVLTPMELNPALKKFIPLALLLFAFFGLTAEGIIFREAITGGGTFILLMALAVATGAIIVPLILPFIPFRSFSLKGTFAGLVLLGLMLLAGFHREMSPLVAAAAAIMTTVIASYLALMFTGTTTFTNISGVKKEMRYAIPAYAVLSAFSVIFLIIFKLQQGGLL